MNRLTPLIARRNGAFASAGSWSLPAGRGTEPATDALADLKMFATGWLGGLVFFGTFFF